MRLFKNAKIYTFNNATSSVELNFPIASMMIVDDSGRIISIGTSIAPEHCAKGTEIVDLEGSAVIPGMIDNHVHLAWVGLKEYGVNVSDKPSWDEIVQAVKERVNVTKPGEIICGEGWNQYAWGTNELPDNTLLNLVAPENPVVLTREDGHTAILNQKALDLVGYTAQTPDPQGGQLIRRQGAQGVELTGVLVDAAFIECFAGLNLFTPELYAVYTLNGAEQFLRNGVTTVRNMSAGLVDVTAQTELYQSGQLHLRVHNFLNINDGQFKAYRDAGSGPVESNFDDKFSVAGAKITLDGSLGSKSAFLREPYAGTDFCGNQMFSDAELYTELHNALTSGFEIAAHAIGDGAVNQIIDAAQKLQGTLSRGQWHQVSIEHFQIASDADITAALELGLALSMQPYHAFQDKNITAQLLQDQQKMDSFKFRSILELGGQIASGTDSPVAPINPFLGIACACKSMLSGQNISRLDALRAYTSWHALERFKSKVGTLEVGKYADFVVLSDDPVTCSHEALHQVHAVNTYVGGAQVA